MIGPPTRVAVQVGSRTVRIAGAAAGGEPRLIAEQPVPTAGVAGLLAEVVGPGPEELLVVHPAGWPARTVAAWAPGMDALAGRVRVCPVPLAAAVELPSVVLDVGHGGTELTRLAADGSVLAWQCTAIGGARLDELLLRRLWPGAAMCTGLTDSPGLIEARRMREHLALLPEFRTTAAGSGPPVAVRRDEVEELLAEPLGVVVDLLRATLGDDPDTPVLLIGGVARTPLLAELIDAAGCRRVAVAPRPEAAAVLGALRLDSLAPVLSGRGPPPAGAGGGAARSSSAPVLSALRSGRHPGPGPGSGIGARTDAGTGVDAGTAASTDTDAAASTGTGTGTGTDVGTGTDPGTSTGTGTGAGIGTGTGAGTGAGTGVGAGTCGVAAADSTARQQYFPASHPHPWRAVLVALGAAVGAAALLGLGVLLFPPAAAVATPAGALVQYGYRVDVPDGWMHAGGLPERRRILLTPAATPQSSEVIAVERTPLGYDSDAERPRALAELRAEFDAAVAGGSALSGYRSGTHAGRAVVRYEQRDGDGRPAVEWFVLLEGDAQFSVGCRHNPSGAAAVRAACALVVGSVRRG